jgi:hypothetical protein
MVKQTRQKPLQKALHLVAWLTGIIVSLAVGFGMIDKTLSLPIWLGGVFVSIVAGWIVVVTTIISVILAILHHM